MEFFLKIELGNDAMATADDLARALRNVAHRLEAGAEGGKIYDANGNPVGQWSLPAEMPEEVTA